MQKGLFFILWNIQSKVPIVGGTPANEVNASNVLWQFGIGHVLEFCLLFLVASRAVQYAGLLKLI